MCLGHVNHIISITAWHQPTHTHTHTHTHTLMSCHLRYTTCSGRSKFQMTGRLHISTWMWAAGIRQTHHITEDCKKEQTLQLCQNTLSITATRSIKTITTPWSHTSHLSSMDDQLPYAERADMMPKTSAMSSRLVTTQDLLRIWLPRPKN
jgi:hypothetical protein